MTDNFDQTDSVSVAFELMLMELSTEVENLNAEGASRFRASDYAEARKLTDKGKALQEFVDKVRALNGEWNDRFAKLDVADRSDGAIAETTRKILSAAKASKTGLLVRFPNGDVIAEASAAETLVAVIKRAGFERVEKLGIKVNSENIVSRTRSTKYHDVPAPPYFIKTHSNTQQKKRNIEQISDALGLRLQVTVIE